MATSTSSISGLASGLDTASIVSQLMQIEAQPQTLLKTRLSTTQTTAAAYRSVNTRFDALRTAAEALTASSLGAAKTATSSSTGVTASASASAVAGTGLSFSVITTAGPQVAMSSASWTSPTDTAASHEPAWPITVKDAKGSTVGQIELPAGATLLDAVAKINSSGYGLKATIVQTGKSQYQLQLTSTGTGTDGVRDVYGDGSTTANQGFAVSSASDASIRLNDANGTTITSSTNTFSELMTGVAVTVSAADSTKLVTVGVGSDPGSVADKVQKLVDAANAALSEIDKQTASSSTSKSTLTGDYTVSSLTGQVLNGFSAVVGSGTSGSSPATIGLATDRDGNVTFDRTKFLAAYAADPDRVTALLSGADAKTTTTTVNGVPTTTTTPAVTGIAQRLAALAKSATDTTTGTLTTLANGQDTRAKDLQKQITDWDTRLAARQATLNAQFNAMETALSTLKNQSSWLSQQLNSLTSSSSPK